MDVSSLLPPAAVSASPAPVRDRGGSCQTYVFLALAVIVSGVGGALPATAGGGSFTLGAADETTGALVPARLQVLRGDGREQLVRRAGPSGVGVVLNQEQELSLPEGAYQFRLTRGPEYRLLTGEFSMERSSLDRTDVALPRMVEMRREDWWSGDVAAVAPARYAGLLMASEDLHFLGRLAGADDTPVRLNLRDPLLKEADDPQA